MLLFFSAEHLYSQAVKNDAFRRFIYQTSIGYANGVGNVKYGDNQDVKNNIPTFRVQQQMAYQFNRYFSLGVGAGVDIWKKNAFIPIFGTFNVNFMKGRMIPHLYMNGGYAFKWYVSSEPDLINRVVHATRPGPFAEGGIGLKIEMTDRLKLVINVNYLLFYSQINYSVIIDGQPDNSNITTNRYDEVPYHFVGVKLGVIY